MVATDGHAIHDMLVMIFQILLDRRNVVVLPGVLPLIMM